jgi:hypothetical protein
VGEHACGAEASTLFTGASFCGEAGSPSLQAGEDVTGLTFFSSFETKPLYFKASYYD